MLASPILRSVITALLFCCLTFLAHGDDALRFPVATENQAWSKLTPENPKLPIWARILAESIPQSTGFMLELDALHRLHNPLGAELVGKVRLVVAMSNHCPYSQSYAKPDLRSIDITDATPAERKIYAFVTKLTLAAYTISDEEVQELLKEMGPDRLVALVHTVAHANFQDRILLALGIESEPGGPLPAVDVKFAKYDPSRMAPNRPDWNETIKKAVQIQALKKNWLEHSFSDLQSSLDRQKALKPRIPLPDWAKVNLPPEQKKRFGRIGWSVVSIGYQPVLTQAWFDCMSSFFREAQLDRVFSQSMFWIVTRTSDCFY
jgi:hypothetical protein